MKSQFLKIFKSWNLAQFLRFWDEIDTPWEIGLRESQEVSNQYIIAFRSNHHFRLGWEASEDRVNGLFYDFQQIYGGSKVPQNQKKIFPSHCPYARATFPRCHKRSREKRIFQSTLIRNLSVCELERENFPILTLRQTRHSHPLLRL